MSAAIKSLKYTVNLKKNKRKKRAYNKNKFSTKFYSGIRYCCLTLIFNSGFGLVKWSLQLSFFCLEMNESHKTLVMSIFNLA